MGKITQYFYRRYLTQSIERFLDAFLNRVKKSYMKRVSIRYLHDIQVKDAFAFIDLKSKPPVIKFQIPVLVALANKYLSEYLSDNVINGIRHEFAHLKYPKHGKQHSAWTRKIPIWNIKK